jgi:Zn-dependent protease with chaperone function
MRDTMNRPRLPWCRKELGHHIGRATRYGLAVGWLAAPWNVAVAIVGPFVRGFRRWVPLGGSARVLMPVVGLIGAGQLAQLQLWSGLVVLVGFGLAMWVQPFAEAAVSRASERAADRYAAQVGAGPDLAAALHVFHSGDATARWRASHPPLERRLQALTGEPAVAPRSAVALASSG